MDAGARIDLHIPDAAGISFFDAAISIGVRPRFGLGSFS